MDDISLEDIYMDETCFFVPSRLIWNNLEDYFSEECEDNCDEVL